MAEQIQPVQAMPGMHVQPGAPMTVVVQKVPIPDGSSLVQLRVETVTGMHIYLFPSDLAKAVANQILEAASGITLAKPTDLPGQGS